MAAIGQAQAAAGIGAVAMLIVGAVLVFTGSFTSYATPQLLGGEKQMMMGTFLYQRAMVTFDWTGASTVAAIMVVVTITIVVGIPMLLLSIRDGSG